METTFHSVVFKTCRSATRDRQIYKKNIRSINSPKFLASTSKLLEKAREIVREAQIKASFWTTDAEFCSSKPS